MIARHTIKFNASIIHKNDDHILSMLNSTSNWFWRNEAEISNRMLRSKEGCGDVQRPRGGNWATPCPVEPSGQNDPKLLDSTS